MVMGKRKCKTIIAVASRSRSSVLPIPPLEAVAISVLSFSCPSGLSVAAIDYAIATLSTAISTAAATLSAAVSAPIEACENASPASCDTAGENVDAPWSRTIAAAVESRAHVTHLLRLSDPVVLRIRHRRVVHLECCCFEMLMGGGKVIVKARVTLMLDF